MRDQVSHPYKTTGKIIVLYTLIFVFLDSNLEDKDSAPNDSKHYEDKNRFLLGIKARCSSPKTGIIVTELLDVVGIMASVP
jgi:hypothetical protein